MADRQLMNQRSMVGRSDRDRGERRNGGSHFPDSVHRIVAFEFVLFTCCLSAAIRLRWTLLT